MEVWLSHTLQNTMNVNEFTNTVNRFPDSSKLIAGMALRGRIEQCPIKCPHCHYYHFYLRGMLFMPLVQAINLSFPVVLKTAK